MDFCAQGSADPGSSISASKCNRTLVSWVGSRSDSSSEKHLQGINNHPFIHVVVAALYKKKCDDVCSGL